MRTEKELLRVTVELHELLSLPVRVEGQFWRGFYQGLLDAMGQLGRSKRFGLLLVAAVMAVPTIQSADRLHLLVAIDLSKTESAAAYGVGKSEFEENLRAVSRLLGDLPAGSRVSVLGITDRTFTNPFLILNARLSDDPGYFSSRLVAARRTLVSEWAKRTKELSASFPHTDVLGFFLYASSVFSSSNSERKVLVILSDMRQELPGGLDLERPEIIDVKESMKFVEKQGLLAPLQGIAIHVFGAGAHAGQKGNVYTKGLAEFWREYFSRCGATLRMFSTTHEIEALSAALRM